MESDLDIKEELLDAPIAWAVYLPGGESPIFVSCTKPPACLFSELRPVPGSVLSAWLQQQDTFLESTTTPACYRLVGTETGRSTSRSSNLSS